MVRFTCIQKHCVNLLAGAPLRPEIHVAEIRSRAPMWQRSLVTARSILSRGILHLFRFVGLNRLRKTGVIHRFNHQPSSSTHFRRPYHYCKNSTNIPKQSWKSTTWFLGKDSNVLSLPIQMNDSARGRHNNPRIFCNYNNNDNIYNNDKKIK